MKELHSLRAAREVNPDAVPTDRIIKLFRDDFLAIRKQRKGSYVTYVVDHHPLSQREICKILGYPSSGAVDGAKKGKIRDDKFDLLRATVAKDLRNPPVWPTSDQFALLAFLQTITKLAGEPFDLEEHECLTRIFCPEWELRMREESTASIQHSLEQMIKALHTYCDTCTWAPPRDRPRVQAGDIVGVINRFGSWFRRCKEAIPGLNS